MTQKRNETNAKKVTLDVAQMKSVLMAQKDFLQPVVQEARRDLKQWLEKWGGKYPKLCAWVEANIEETWTFYRLPLAHHKHLKSTNLLERFNQEVKRRTLVVRIFPNEASCLRLVRAIAAEQHEAWMEGSRYLNTDLLREQIKPMNERLAMAA